MNVKDYLSQGYLLDQRINYNLQRLQQMRAAMDGVGSPRLGDVRVRTSQDGEAPFVKAYMRMAELDERINREIDLLVDLRNQIDEVIGSVESEKHHMLLLYRYVEGQSWEEISYRFRAGESTVRRWHEEALRMVKMPEDPIIIRHVR